MTKNLLTACVCLCLAAGTLQAKNEDRALVATARKILKTHEKAVISLSVIRKVEFKIMGIGGAPDLDQELEVQCAAVIIDAGGLAVTSLTNLEGGEMPKVPVSVGGGEGKSLTFECHVQEVKYRLADGTELPARVVLKDEDLDLVFLSPQKPLDEQTRSKIAALPLGDAAPQAELLDVTIHLNRANGDLNYTPMLGLGRIVALLSKPRTCYVSDTAALGTPVFDRQGKILGIVCHCMKKGGDEESEAGGMMGMMTRMGLMRGTGPQHVAGSLILPAAAVARLVPQAKEEIKKYADAEKK